MESTFANQALIGDTLFLDKDIQNTSLEIATDWLGSALVKESSLHQVSPYIGKIKSTMASSLIESFTTKGQTVYDPFCGSGTVALEAWVANRQVIANDLSPYAVTLTRAKLFPYLSTEEAYKDLERFAKQVKKIAPQIELSIVPDWVRAFFDPQTLRETIAWSRVLRAKRNYFMLSCLLGILHHQRPGFLSFPSSHTVPYLREKKFPRQTYPTLYEYRPVRERLERKVARALKRLPQLNNEIERNCYSRDAACFAPSIKVDAIITSPPYMRQLDYGRDNRLRLWFLGQSDWKALDEKVSPNETRFLEMFRRCLKQWHEILAPSGKCVLVLGDTYSRHYGMPLPDVISQIAVNEIKGYRLAWEYTEDIPANRRVRREHKGSQKETILVLRKDATT
jgi:DNA modification methylase